MFTAIGVLLRVEEVVVKKTSSSLGCLTSMRKPLYYTIFVGIACSFNM